MPASSWTLWNRLSMIGGPCREAGSCTTAIEAANTSPSDTPSAWRRPASSLRRGPWRSCEAVEFATLEWVDWFNNRRLLEPIGNIPPAEAEERYYAMLDEPAMAA